MDELRNIYSLRLCSLRRKGDIRADGAGDNATDTGATGAQIPSDLLRLLRRVMMGMVEVIEKGNAFDEALSKSVCNVTVPVWGLPLH